MQFLNNILTLAACTVAALPQTELGPAEAGDVGYGSGTDGAAPPDAYGTREQVTGGYNPASPFADFCLGNSNCINGYPKGA